MLIGGVTSPTVITDPLAAPSGDTTGAGSETANPVSEPSEPADIGQDGAGTGQDSQGQDGPGQDSQTGADPQGGAGPFTAGPTPTSAQAADVASPSAGVDAGVDGLTAVDDPSQAFELARARDIALAAQSRAIVASVLDGLANTPEASPLFEWQEAGDASDTVREAYQAARATQEQPASESVWRAA